MALTHLTRAGSASLRLKVDLEAAILSCYGEDGGASDTTEATRMMLVRLRRLFGNDKRRLGLDRQSKNSLIHGYIFDAWSLRRCSDEFLELSVHWKLDTNDYLKLMLGLGMENNMLADLTGINSITQKQALLSQLLGSQELTSEFLVALLNWSVDQMLALDPPSECSSESSLRLSPDNNQKTTEVSWGCLWMEALRISQQCRHLLRGQLSLLLQGLLTQRFRRLEQGDSHTRERIMEAFKSARDLVFKILQLLVEFGPTDYGHKADYTKWENRLQKCRDAAQLWDSLGGTYTSSDLFTSLIPGYQEKAGGTKSIVRLERLNRCIGRDTQSFKDSLDYNITQQDRTHTTNATDARLASHLHAFVSICNTVRLHQEVPEVPSRSIARLSNVWPLLESNGSNAGLESNQADMHKRWVETTIARRSPGWQSCVKLKLQFLAIFDLSLEKTFADLIYECNLHWDLCDTLKRYTRGLRTNSTWITVEKIRQCFDILLALFPKLSISLRQQLRDYLYQISRTLGSSAKDPTFGSWEYWDVDIGATLTSALNQVVQNDNGLSSSIPTRVYELLLKASLICPYQTVIKILESAVTNRGQCSIMLQVLTSLGQLPWLRGNANEPTMLVVVLSDIIIARKELSEDKPPLVANDSRLLESHFWDDQRQDNFHEAVVSAFTRVLPQHDLALLDSLEFMNVCVAPLFERMIEPESQQPPRLNSNCFRSVARIILSLYDAETPHPITWLLDSIHTRLLIRLLQLRTASSIWTTNHLLLGSTQRTNLALNKKKSGSLDMESIARLCNRVVGRLTDFTRDANTPLDLCPQDLVLQKQTEAAQGFVKQLYSSSLGIDLESRMTAIPLLSAYKYYLKQEILYPELPRMIHLLCGDGLTLFKYSSEALVEIQERDRSEYGGNFAIAIALFLGLGRICDEVVLDMLQAVKRNDHHREVDGLKAKRMVTIALYRVLSISSRAESQRLLVKVLPLLIKLWGGSRSQDATIFWHTDETKKVEPSSNGGHNSNGATTQQHICTTWRSEAYIGSTLDRIRLIPQDDKQEMNQMEAILTVLFMSEALLRLALDPSPELYKDDWECVHAIGLGYDMAVDQITSLVLASVKAMQADCPKPLLDFILLSFMLFSRMSNIASPGTVGSTSRGTQERTSRNKDDNSLEPLIEPKHSPSLQPSKRLFEETSIDARQLARLKARDELVLMAMNASDEIVKLQDAHYGPVTLKKRKGDSTTKASKKRGRRQRFRDGEESAQQAALPSDTIQYSLGSRGRTRPSAPPRANGSMDDSTLAWFNSIMTKTPPKQTDSKNGPLSDEQVEAQKTLPTQAGPEANLVPPAQETQKGWITGAKQEITDEHPKTPRAQPNNEETPKETQEGAESTSHPTSPTALQPQDMLSQDQVNCLLAALMYLPEQEREAIRARLSRILSPNDKGFIQHTDDSATSEKS